jgi:hypothetical protein
MYCLDPLQEAQTNSKSEWIMTERAMKTNFGADDSAEPELSECEQDAPSNGG